MPYVVPGQGAVNAKEQPIVPEEPKRSGFDPTATPAISS
jgi:hypothetical protein